MTWDELAKQAMNSYENGMSNAYPYGFCPGDEWEELEQQHRDVWIDLVKQIYNQAYENSRADMVKMICGEGL